MSRGILGIHAGEEVKTNAAAGQVIQVWGPQVEIGAYATAYIQTGSAPVTTTDAYHVITATSASDPTKIVGTSLKVQ